ncbi:MAG TPA: C4-type zinc ribbon domain-containing protein [Clostridia bacterium]|nr:C4-type zinc ribbon domain-containing protein [Clostridia bacterium]
MKFDNILEYQKIDADLIVIEDAIKGSRERALTFNAKSKLDEATEMIKRLHAESTDVISQYERISQKANELVAKINELDGIIGKAGDLNEVEYYNKMLAGLVDELSQLEKDLNKDISKVDVITANFKSTWEAGQKATALYKNARNEYEKLKAEKTSEAKPLVEKLEELSKNIEPRIIEIYKSLRANRKLPAFVEYVPEDKRCGRCFMDLPSDAQTKLKKAGDVSECPNCHRFLYIPD